MKREDKQNSGKLNDIFYNEVACMKQLNHLNIIRLVDYSDKSTAIKENGSKINVNYIAMEYAENGELFDYVAQTGKFSEPEARFYFHQLIGALEYMHSEGYAHRDIKPENLLLDGEFNLKIADFGFATKDSVSKSKKGTYGYMAPEVLAGEEYRGEEADLFASAVILFILLCQHPPFVRAEPTDRYYKRIVNGRYDKFWKVYEDDGFSESFIDLFSKMIAYDSTDRLTLKEVKDHEWFNGPVCSPADIIENFNQRRTTIKRASLDKPEEEEDRGSKKRKTTKRKKEKKFTKFFDVGDGDDLIDAIVELSAKKGYKFEKSQEYYRVELTIVSRECETRILVNVAKNPNAESR